MPQTLIRLLAVAVFSALTGAVIFASAGRTDLPWVWTLLAAQTAFMILFALGMPGELLRERLKPGGEGRVNDHHRALVIPLILVSWVVAGLDVGRYHWSDTIPSWLRVVGLIGYAIGMMLTFWAMRANRFYSSVIRLQLDRGHQPVTSGPYRFVRHPGYVGTLLALLCGTLVLGSWITMLPALAMLLLFLRRTINEDRMLRRDLDGYEAYAQRVRSRLVPGVW
jgi:protein-S-isoprenylcysteine O-methyltransferase Ste14